MKRPNETHVIDHHHSLFFRARFGPESKPTPGNKYLFVSETVYGTHLQPCFLMAKYHASKIATKQKSEMMFFLLHYDRKMKVMAAKKSNSLLVVHNFQKLPMMKLTWSN